MRLACRQHKLNVVVSWLNVVQVCAREVDRLQFDTYFCVRTPVLFLISGTVHMNEHTRTKVQFYMKISGRIYSQRSTRTPSRANTIGSTRY